MTGPCPACGAVRARRAGCNPGCKSSWVSPIAGGGLACIMEAVLSGHGPDSYFHDLPLASRGGNEFPCVNLHEHPPKGL